METIYQRHVFFCLNRRDVANGGVPDCASANAAAMHGHAKTRVKEAGLAGAGGVRVNKAGCLGRCALGPAVVVYPEGTWYTYVDEEDVNEIVDSHLGRGKPVKRLKMDP